MSRPAGRRRLAYGRAVEFALAFMVLPILGGFQGDVLKRWIVPQILLAGLACLIVLRRDRSFHWRNLFRMQDLRPQMLRIGVLFAAGGTALFVWALGSGIVDLFRFPRQRPGLWLAVLLLYPLVSALLQELVFRVFVFHRYRSLFTTPGRMIAASALTFSLAHLMLGNWLAPVLSLAGGLLFAWTYARTGSLLLVTLEHGLWGDWLFTLGFGRYFYGGHY